MIHHADEALRSWFGELPIDGGIEVSFEPNPPDAAKKAKATPVSLLLSGVREQLDKRDTELRDLRDDAGRVVGRQRSVRWFELDYVCSVSGPPIRAHEVLGGVLQLLVDHDVVPDEHLPDALTSIGEPIEVSVIAGGSPTRGAGAGISLRVVVPVRPTAEREIAPPAVELHLEMVPAPGRTDDTGNADSTVTDDEPDPVAAREWTTVRRRERISPTTQGPN